MQIKWINTTFVKEMNKRLGKGVGSLSQALPMGAQIVNLSGKSSLIVWRKALKCLYPKENNQQREHNLVLYNIHRVIIFNNPTLAESKLWISKL